MTEVHPGTAAGVNLNSSTTVSPNWLAVVPLGKMSTGWSATGSEEKFLFLQERTLTGQEVGRGGEAAARPGGGDFVHCVGLGVSDGQLVALVGLVTVARVGAMLVVVVPEVVAVEISLLSTSLSSVSLKELRKRVLLIVSITFWKCFWSLRMLVGRLIEMVAFSSVVAFTETFGNSLSSSVTVSLALGGLAVVSLVFSGERITQP